MTHCKKGNKLGTQCNNSGCDFPECADLDNKEITPFRYELLEINVLLWASDKGIFDKATREAQADKTLEEVNELIEAIKQDDAPEVKDALGDILVTIIIQAEMNGLSLLDCLETAYNVISKRTGKMIDGKFVKDE